MYIFFKAMNVNLVMFCFPSLAQIFCMGGHYPSLMQINHLEAELASLKYGGGGSSVHVKNGLKIPEDASFCH